MLQAVLKEVSESGMGPGLVGGLEHVFPHIGNTHPIYWEYSSHILGMIIPHIGNKHEKNIYKNIENHMRSEPWSKKCGLLI